MSIDHLQKVSERLMEDKNFLLQDLISFYASDVLDIGIRDNNGRLINIDSVEFTTRLEALIKKTSEEIREEDEENKKNDYLDGDEAEAG